MPLKWCPILTRQAGFYKKILSVYIPPSRYHEDTQNLDITDFTILQSILAGSMASITPAFQIAYHI